MQLFRLSKSFSEEELHSALRAARVSSTTVLKRVVEFVRITAGVYTPTRNNTIYSAQLHIHSRGILFVDSMSFNDSKVIFKLDIFCVAYHLFVVARSGC